MIFRDNSIEEDLAEHLDVLRSMHLLKKEIKKIIDLITRAFKSGHRLFLCGNGGSAADAQHIAAEFVGRYLKERDPLPAMALTVNSSSLTALANDYSYESVFSRQLDAFGQENDVLIGITTSGSSENVLKAMLMAKKKKIKTIIFTGEQGKKLEQEVDGCLAIPSKSTPRIQEMHILVGHMIAGIVEDEISRSRY